MHIIITECLAKNITALAKAKAAQLSLISHICLSSNACRPIHTTCLPRIQHPPSHDHTTGAITVLLDIQTT